MNLRFSVAAAALVLTACPAEKPAPAPAPSAAPTPPPRAGKLTVLVTGHEMGTLPAKAPRLLAQWKKLDGWPDAVALSTGDTASGAVLSSYFQGAPTAEVMKALQYRAAALGNREFDRSLETLQTLREASGITLLGANLKDKADAARPLKLAPSAVFEVRGLKVGVVGFTGSKTLSTPVAGRTAELELLPLDAAVGPALESLKKSTPDLVVALIDDCFSTLQPVLQAHAEWKVDLVVGTACPELKDDVSGATRYLSAGDALSSYVALAFELKPDGTRSLTVERRDLPESGDEDAALAAVRERWQKKLDAELGQPIGFTRAGYKAEAPQLYTLVATAWRDEAKADAALLNKKAVRAALPKGPITRASIYELMPFENAVLTVKVKGAVLSRLKANKEAFVLLPPGLKPNKEYLLATTEYVYFGGDGLGLEADAPNPELSGEIAQTPIIAWLTRQQSTEKKPLEKLLK